MKNNEIKDTPVNPESLQDITPAQCFIDGKAIVTVDFPEILGTKNGAEYKKVSYLIVSDGAGKEREKIKLSQDELIKRGYFSDRTPNIQGRWSIASIKSFLAHDSKTIIPMDVFDDISVLYKEFSDFGDSRTSSLLACWTIGTYFHRIFNTFPYIHLNGHLQTGKSKTISLTTLLAFNGETNVGSTASFLVRSVHDNCSTIGIDEAENLGHDEDSRVLVQILNAGYKKGAMVGKSESTGKNGWEVKRFDPYSPKIFGGIKRIAPTLVSRSISITMLRSNDDKIRNEEIDFTDQRFKEIRDNLYLMMMTCHPMIRATYKLLEDEKIKGREWELWKPIFAIAKTISEETYGELRTFALEIQGQKNESIEDDANATAFLESLLYMTEQRQSANQFGEIINDNDSFYTTYDIKNSLTNYESPHCDIFIWLRSGKNYGRWIGDELRKMGVVKGNAKQQKVAGINKRGYNLDRTQIEKQIEIYKGL